MHGEEINHADHPDRQYTEDGDLVDMDKRLIKDTAAYLKRRTCRGNYHRH